MQHNKHTETWVRAIAWPYLVSNYGHVRRSRGTAKTRLDKEGYTIVTLQRGVHQEDVYLDSLVYATFNQRKVNGERPVHLDGLPWNNWASNLRESHMAGVGNSTNLVVSWIVFNDGKLQHGPFTEWQAAYSAAMRIGDTIVGRNRNGDILTYDLVFSNDRSISPRNPFHMIKRYRAQANMHSNQMWSIELSEAALLLEVMAVQAIGRLAGARREQVEQDYDSIYQSTGTVAVVAPIQRQRRATTAPAATPPTDPYLNGISRRRATTTPAPPADSLIGWPLRTTDAPLRRQRASTVRA